MLSREDEIRETKKAILAALNSEGPFDAHRLVFGPTNKFPSPDFHPLLARSLHGQRGPRTVDEAFRRGAKSTMAEQAAALRASFGLFRYALILAETYGKAVQRLASIKSIISGNPVLLRIFGDMKGATWNEGKATLGNGVTLEAIGARQSIRGFKEGEQRPDWLLIDDLETPEWVKTPEEIEANVSWLFREVIPALDDADRTPIRMIGTPLAKNSLLRQLAGSNEWESQAFPIRHLDAAGELRSSWPEVFSLEAIAKIEANFTALGQHRMFMQEYMMEAESEQEQVFTPPMLTCEPRVRTWQAIYAAIDPARTTKATSAQTGRAVWSWSGDRLSVWECGGEYLMPDEVVSLAFRIHETYRPVEIGVEEDGLNQWLLQPLRAAQVQRGIIPVRPLKAPRGKIDFIKGLQPFFKDGRARFCLESGDAGDKFTNAIAQFLSFPRGVIDAPNALAYATALRPGVPVYPDFTTDCVAVGAELLARKPAVLCLNADGSRVTALLMQEHGGISTVFGEWVEEGLPGDVVADIFRDATLRCGSAPLVVIGRHHTENKYSNFGLSQALHRCNAGPRPGGDVAKGRVEVQAMLRRRIRGYPALMVADGCRFTLNGFAAGFAYPVQFNVVADQPASGIYRTLLEGLECFVASAIVAGEDEVGNFRHTADGRQYRSAMKS